MKTKKFLNRTRICLFFFFLVGASVRPELLFPSPTVDVNERGNKGVIAIVKEGGIPAYDLAVEGFREILEKENMNVRSSVFDQDDKSLISRLKEFKPLLILTIGAAATKKVSDEIKDIPVIYSLVVDPKGSGLIARNIIGASAAMPIRIQLETLKNAAPGVKRIGIIYNPKENESLVQEAVPLAAELGFTLKTYAVSSEREIPGIENLQIDILWVIPDMMVSRSAIVYRFIQTGIKSNTAVMGFTRSYAQSGALLGLSCDYKDIGMQSGELAAKLLRGESYSNLKPCEPRKVHIFINLTAADLLGIKITKQIIKKASEVF